MVKFKQIIEFIIYILKILLYFDTRNIKYNKKYGGSNNNKDKDKQADEDEDDEITQENIDNASTFFSRLKEIFINVLDKVQELGLGLISLILFASVAPIIPFFVSIVGLFGVLKYYMFKLRRL